MGNVYSDSFLIRVSYVQLYKDGISSFQDGSDALTSVLPTAWPCLSLHGFSSCPALLQVSAPIDVCGSE